MFFLILIVALTIAAPLTVDYVRNPSASQVVQAKEEAAEFTREAINGLHTKVQVRAQAKLLDLFLSFVTALFFYIRQWLKASIGGPKYRS